MIRDIPTNYPRSSDYPVDEPFGANQPIAKLSPLVYRTWVEISQTNLIHNLNLLKKLSHSDHQKSFKHLVSATLKSNAYGHGLVEIGRILQKIDPALWLNVQSLEEAKILRQNQIYNPILVISSIFTHELQNIINLDVRCFLYDFNLAKQLNELATKKNTQVKVHLMVDTGMNCQGINPEDLIRFIDLLKTCPNLILEGVCTHFSSSDNFDDPAFFQQQQAKFRQIQLQLVDYLGSAAESIIFHANNSGAIISNFLRPPTEKLTLPKCPQLVRPGISLYGLLPDPSLGTAGQTRGIGFKPVLSWKTRLGFIKQIPAGSVIGYGCTHTTTRLTRIGLIPVGYYDGLDRGLSNQGAVLIAGQKCPILGRICMNLTVLDLTDLNLSDQNLLNQEVVIIGQQGSQSISADDLASQIGTINYEIVARIRESIPRIVVN
jgi:alanine racemase